jgi:hypothetical protein
MQVAMRTLALSVAASVFFCMTLPIHAQGNDPLTAIRQKLQERITLATLDGNGDIATAGSVVTLKISPCSCVLLPTRVPRLMQALRLIHTRTGSCRLECLYGDWAWELRR